MTLRARKALGSFLIAVATQATAASEPPRQGKIDQGVRREALTHALKVAPGYITAEIPYSGAPFAWVDSETVLFTGIRNHPTDPNAAPGPLALYRWNVKTGTVAEVMKVGDAPDICYDRGYLYIAFNRGDERVIWQGPIDKQQEVVVKRQAPSPFKGYFNRYNCRFREVPSATQQDHQVVAVLRDDHGFIEAERPPKPLVQRQYFLVRPPGQRIRLSESLACGAGGPLFSESRQAYVYQDGGGFSSRNVERLVCLVGIDGVVTNYRIPKGKWLQGTVYGMPVKDGILLISLSTLANAEGAYLVKGSDVKRILKSYINAFSVSPDGCNVALYIRPDDGGGPHHALARFCEEK